MTKPAKATSGTLVQTLRLLAAETLLGWAFAIAPKDHPDTVRLTQCLHDYMAGQKHRSPPTKPRYGTGEYWTTASEEEKIAGYYELNRMRKDTTALRRSMKPETVLEIARRSKRN